MTTADLYPVDLTSIYDEIADFLASAPTSKQIIDFHLSEGSERLISNLLEANRTRGLSPSEKEALDDYTHIEHLMQSIKVHNL
jgi:hypothetical protein